jgi:hypothetical protein
VATDRVAGFQLDRGFQVLLTPYPEARRLLDDGCRTLTTGGLGLIFWWNPSPQWRAFE